MLISHTQVNFKIKYHIGFHCVVNGPETSLKMDSKAFFMFLLTFSSFPKVIRNGQKLHGNYRINIFGAKQTNFLVSGRKIPPPSPLTHTLGVTLFEI